MINKRLLIPFILIILALPLGLVGHHFSEENKDITANYSPCQASIAKDKTDVSNGTG